VSNWCAILALSSLEAAMAEPVNEPGFGAREKEMGIHFAAFKPQVDKLRQPFAHPRR
jgi:hypothetical protein